MNVVCYLVLDRADEEFEDPSVEHRPPPLLLLLLSRFFFFLFIVVLVLVLATFIASRFPIAAAPALVVDYRSASAPSHHGGSRRPRYPPANLIESLHNGT
ncbi:hypothetical protein NW759_016349 [Fusarium solani]|nr:hypothetical protein NW759_016349 [Fusarium solani]